LWTTTREALGKTWTVGLWPNDVALGSTDGLGSGLTGSTHIRDQVIAVKAAGPPDQKDETLLHELLETSFVKMDIPYEEATINRLTSTLFAFLRGFGLWHEFPWPDRQENCTQVQERDG